MGEWMTSNAFHISLVIFIMGSVPALASATGPHGWPVWAAAILFIVLFGLLNYAADDATDRLRITRLIEREDNLGLYSALVRRLTQMLTRMMSPETAEDKPPPVTGWWGPKLEWWTTPRAMDPADLTRLQNSTTSWPVMDTALKLAVIYPLFMLLAQWWWTGADTGIGAVTVLTAYDNFLLRSALFCPLALALVAQFYASARQRHIEKQVADVLFFCAVAGAVAGAVAVAVAGAVASVIMLSKACQNGRGRRAYLLFVFTALAATLCAVILMPQPAEDAFDRRILVFAFGPLILINAIFDFISYALTLHLIKIGKARGKRRAFLFGVMDAGAAVVLLFSLAFTLLCCVALINALAPAPLLDIQTVLNDLKQADTRTPYTWLYLTLFSTLVPTLVHLCIATLSVLAIVPLRHKETVAHLIGPDSGGHLTTLAGTLAASVTGVAFTAFITAMFMGLWWVLSTHTGTFALWLLNKVEWAAATLSLI